MHMHRYNEFIENTMQMIFPHCVRIGVGSNMCIYLYDIFLVAVNRTEEKKFGNDCR